MIKRLLTNTAIQASGRVGGLVIGVVSMAMLARYLGQEAFGWYIVAFSWLQLFAISVDFGLYMVGLKLLGEVGEHTNTTREGDQRHVFSQLFWLRLFSAIALVLIAPHIVWLFPYTLSIKVAVTILSWSFFFASLNQMLVVSFQHQFRMRVVACGEVVSKGVALLMLWLVVLLNLGFGAALATAIVYGVVQFVVLWSLLARQHAVQWVWDRVLVRTIVQQSWPLGVIIILNTLYFKADTVILSWFWDADVVGLYGAAYKVLEIIVSFPAMYLGLLLPLLAEWWRAQDLRSLHTALQKSFDLSVFVAVPMVAIIALVADDVMLLIAGSEFVAAGQWLRLLVVAAGFVFFGQLFGYVMVGIGHQIQQMKQFGYIAIGAIGAYLVVIPFYGSVGAALVTIVAEAVVAVALYVYVQRVTSWRLMGVASAKLLLAGVLCYGLLWLLLFLVHWAIASGIAMAGYLACVYMLRVVSFGDIKRLMNT